MSMGRKLLLVLVALYFVQATEPNAFCAFIFNVQQVGQNVIVNGSGTINTDALSRFSQQSRFATIVPANGTLCAGPVAQTPAAQFYGLLGAINFGSGGQTNATSGSGDIVGVEFENRVVVPSGYISGTPLADSATYNSQTFSSLGLTQGTYVYTWGTGPTADSLTINIGTGVPEPASAALIAAPIAIAALRRCRRVVG
jgi:hypothetical protein